MVKHTSTQHVATQLARQGARAIQAHHAAESARLPTGGHFDRLRSAQAEPSFHPAGSGEGALFQLRALYAVVEELADSETTARLLKRYVASLTTFIEETTGAHRGMLAGFCLPEEE